ncbi:MAG: hypothetical protein HYY01_02260 [Chloroflexi bacterium]|nr:hypothetical protein [Chloroflexota bacterium]
MITVNVVVDGKTVATAGCASKFALPDLIAGMTAPWDQSPDFIWQREDRIKDASGDLVQVRVCYKSAMEMPAAA